MIDLSICIPTYNRVYHLNNCLNAIKIAKINSNISLEVCISDNNSVEDIISVVNKYKENLKIIYNRNEQNIGMGKNILKSVSLASGKFCWIIGNDDIILPNTFHKLFRIISQNPDVDFFYANSYQIDLKDLKNYNHPLNTKEFNFLRYKKFSNYNKSLKLKFFDLIDPKKSYEFLLSIFLCIFNRNIWNNNLHVIDEKKISDVRFYSNFYNTAPHVKIWSAGFCKKLAYFISDPLTANIHGPRSDDWGHLYPYVEGVIIPQVLDTYRKSGLPFFQYILCKNYALRRLIPAFFNMIRNKNNSNIQYVNFKKDFFFNLFYPMVYLSLIVILIRRFKYLFKNLIRS